MNRGIKRILFKVCGLANKKDIDECVEAGVDALGFLLGNNHDGTSLDKLNIIEAKELIRYVPSGINSVLLTKETDPNKINSAFEIAQPTSIQLQSSDLSAEDIVILRKMLPTVKLIKTVRIKEDTDVNSIRQLLSDIYPSVDAILLDAERGGSGQTIDWNISRQISDVVRAFRLQIILAGGLSEENVSSAIKMVCPHMVDIMTGVSVSRGVKDIKKVKSIRNILDTLADTHGY